jgi:hypothetical protein
MQSLIQSWFGKKREKHYAVDSYNIGMEDVQLVVRSMQSKIRKGVMTDFHKILLLTTIGAEFTPSYRVLDWKKEDGIPLILGTLSSEEEEAVINGMLEDEGVNENTQHSEDGMLIDLDDVLIVVYGQGSGDESVLKKVKLLRSLGFGNTFCYLGGMMEWLLLRDIYGDVEFPLLCGGVVGGVGGGGVAKNVDPLFYKMERKLV